MGADVRLVSLLVLALVAQAAARVHTVLLTPSTPSPAWLPDAQAVNFTLAAGRASARVVQSSRAAPCTPGGFARALDAGTPFFVWHPGAEGAEEEVWFYVDGECHEEQRAKEGAQRLARRKDLDWAQLWGIVLGIAFGLVALAAFACCSWCCCFQHRVRAHQARLHVRDEGVQTGAAHNTELPLYERRVRDGEVQLEEAPAPDYHLATRRAAPGVGVGVGVEVGVEVGVGVGMGVEGVRPPEGVQPAPEGVPLPPSPRDPPPSAGPRDSSVSMPMPQPYAPGPQGTTGAAPPRPPDDLPPAYSHAPP